MGDSSKEQKEKKHLRKRKKWAGICQKLQDDEWEMSSDFKLDLLQQRKNISIEIWWDLKKEEKILQADISYWEADIKRLEKETEESSDESQCASSCEETEEDEEESQCSNESQCASSCEETEEDEEESQCSNESQCATCSAREYLGYLNSLGYFNSEEDETRYLKAEQELRELESDSSDSPDCAACLARWEKNI